MNESRIQAMFKRSKPNNLSIFIISHENRELPKGTIRANGNIYHIFKPKNFRDVQSFYQDKAGMDTVNREFKYLTGTCRDKNINLFFNLTKDKFTGRCRLGLISFFVPETNLF